MYLFSGMGLYSDVRGFVPPDSFRGVPPQCKMYTGGGGGGQGLNRILFIVDYRVKLNLLRDHVDKTVRLRYTNAIVTRVF